LLTPKGKSQESQINVILGIILRNVLVDILRDSSSS
jgi:hypothetical protein